MNAYELLQSSAVFSGLNKEHIESIAHITRPQNFDTGELLISENDDPDCCYLISSGSLQIFRTINRNDTLIIGELGPGDILGELSIIDSLPRSASAITLSPTETLTIAKSDFTALLRTYPEICFALLTIISRHLRKANDDLYLMGYVMRF